jgi:hypothetical protein
VIDSRYFHGLPGYFCSARPITIFDWPSSPGASTAIKPSFVTFGLPSPSMASCREGECEITIGRPAPFARQVHSAAFMR